MLKPAELPRPLPESNVVDYPAVNSLKDALLVAAQDNFRRTAGPELRHDFEQFCRDQAGWLDDYALFRALRIDQGDREFHAWPPGLMRHEPEALAESRKQLSDLVDRFRLGQFLAYRQLRRLREHARKRGVGLIGDVPFFVSPDSSDVWAHPELFLLDAERQPRFVAGVPPDYFSARRTTLGRPALRLGHAPPYRLRMVARADRHSAVPRRHRPPRSLSAPSPRPGTFPPERRRPSTANGGPVPGPIFCRPSKLDSGRCR